MATMTVRVLNATFESESTSEFDTLDHAFGEALRSGVEIATQEVLGGSKSVIVQIAVDVDGRRNAARGAVSISTERFLGRSSVSPGEHANER